MKGPVYKESHEVTMFNFFPQPPGYDAPGYRRSTTTLNKSEEILIGDVDNVQYLLYTVIINATNSFENKPLATIQLTSTYLVEYNITGQLSIDLSCDLVFRSMQHCYNSYMDKVKGSHLNNDTITIPETANEDCRKQKSELAQKN